MKKIAVLSALVLLSASVAGGHLAFSSDAYGVRAVRAAADPSPTGPFYCPCCGGNRMLHARRMELVEALQAQSMCEALRWDRAFAATGIRCRRAALRPIDAASVLAPTAERPDPEGAR